ncbi:MAG: 16S rRNA (uracil(1498)-N(3))-methyltransferase [Bdellovibrionaceae bacterium]|nr:16S rRNA (uracil(1498)-N(3))-methyltransferase [Pseudobdellovibrionaceae bacterium]
MRRYWVPSEAIEGDSVRLTGDTLHHIRDVCRMYAGSKFEVLHDNQAYLVEIVSESKHESRARVLEKRMIAPRPKPDLVLVMAIPRFPVFEAVIEKAVELGVARIQPVFSEFSFIRTQDAVLEKKRPRWEKIVQSATQQSGRGDWMRIEPAMPLSAALEGLNRSPGAKGLFAYEGEGVLSAKVALEKMNPGEAGGDILQECQVFIGAEGGFSSKEVELFREFGLAPVTLGSQVLRVETACVALVSILKYHFDQMR